MTNMDTEQAYHLQRFYCIALVALVERLKNPQLFDVSVLTSIAHTVAPSVASSP